MAPSVEKEYCYGSDEEQARTTAGDAVEQKHHIHRLQQNWKGDRDEKKCKKQIYVVHLE